MSKGKLAEKPIPSTPMQKRLARRIPEIIASNQNITGGELVKSVGYGHSMSRKPGEVLNSRGVQAELEIIGFTEEKAKEVVAVILGDEDEKADSRLKAAEMVFKTFGTFVPDRSVSVNVNVNPQNPKALELAREFEEKLKTSL